MDMDAQVCHSVCLPTRLSIHVPLSHIASGMCILGIFRIRVMPYSAEAVHSKNDEYESRHNHVSVLLGLKEHPPVEK